MSGTDKSRLVDALTLAKTRRIPKAGFGAPVGDNTVDRLGLDGLGTQQATDPLQFLGYHGACVGDIASMHAGVEPRRTGENWPKGQYELPGFYIAKEFETAKYFAKKRGEKLPSSYSGEEKKLAVVEVFIPKCVNLPDTIIPVIGVKDMKSFGDDIELFMDLFEKRFHSITSIEGFSVPGNVTLWTDSRSFGKEKASDVRRTMRDYRALGVQGSIRGLPGKQIFIAKVGCKWLRFGNAKLI